MAHPNLPYLFKSQKYKTKTGAIPKLTKSVSESNSFPNSDVPLINLAILPSSASKIAAIKIKFTAKLKLPSIENFIELIPKHTPPKLKYLEVSILFFLRKLF